MANLSPLSGLTAGAAALWIAGARLRARLYASGLLRRRKLRARVVSIGNLSWGGSGKTPFAIWLADRLQKESLAISILTRGYGRTSRERVKVLPPGTTPDSARAEGDEVQIFLRHLSLPIGISASRYEAGSTLENTYPVDVHLLDDGFQHLALERYLDLVLIDASNPWGARPGWPLLLREGFSSLRRAHAVLLTRCELAESSGSGLGNETNVEKLKSAIASYNPDALCFTLRTKLLQFNSYGGEKCLSTKELRACRPFAFCAVGNPQSFLRMLERAGFAVTGKKAFPDHHRYNAQDLDLLARLAKESNADCFVTTEKDIVNIPSAAALPLPLYWAEIEPVVDTEDGLIRWILEKLNLPAGPRHVEPAPQGGIEQPHLAGTG